LALSPKINFVGHSKHMPGDWLKVGGPEPVISTKTVYVEKFSLRSPQKERSTAMKIVEQEMYRQGHTIVAGTARVSRNRDWNGRFERGWKVVVGVIKDGQRIGLGEIIAMQDPRGPLNYYQFEGIR
jgi:hypothetical protein